MLKSVSDPRLKVEGKGEATSSHVWVHRFEIAVDARRTCHRVEFLQQALDALLWAPPAAYFVSNAASRHGVSRTGSTGPRPSIRRPHNPAIGLPASDEPGLQIGAALIVSVNAWATVHRRCRAKNSIALSLRIIRATCWACADVMRPLSTRPASTSPTVVRAMMQWPKAPSGIQ